MTEYLNYKFEDNDAFISTFDEAPLWSASFGLLLFKHLSLKPNITVLDIGSGAGFPLMELAGRLGNSCKLIGIDPWVNANAMAMQKIKNYGYTNVELVQASAEKIPFSENTIDLIVSNLGINNFEKPAVVFKECHRVLKQNCTLALTTNLTGHWKEFYEVFYRTLKEMGKENHIPVLKKEEAHRGTVESVSKLFTDNGFTDITLFEEVMQMTFVDGSAFLNHYFIKLGWLSSWMKLFPPNELQEIFSTLEQNLNHYAKTGHQLALTVPMIYMEGKKK